VIYEALFWIWFGLIAVFSLMPGKTLEGTGIVLSSTGFWEHILAYGVLAVLGARAYAGRRLGIILAGALLVSVGFEMIQFLFLERTFNPMDVAANGIGLGTGWLSFKVLRC